MPLSNAEDNQEDQATTTYIVKPTHMNSETWQEHDEVEDSRHQEEDNRRTASSSRKAFENHPDDHINQGKRPVFLPS